MRGVVDDSGRAILPIEILCPEYPTGVQVDAWIDTGFTGDLVLPQSLIDDLQLEVTGSIDGVPADGSAIELSTYHCELDWFGKRRSLEVIANSGQTPLLGVGLLLAKELRVDYSNSRIDPNTQTEANEVVTRPITVAHSLFLWIVRRSIEHWHIRS